MIRSMAFLVGFCLLATPCLAQETPPAPAPGAGDAGVASAPEKAPADDATAAPAPIVPPSYAPYIANYGANYFYPYYAYAPGFVFPAYNYTPISPIAYPVYGYYPYYYGAYASPFYGVGYGYGYVPVTTYGGYYSWYNPYPGVGWYTGYGYPFYMGW